MGSRRRSCCRTRCGWARRFRSVWSSSRSPTASPRSTFNRPDALNALNPEAVAQFRALLEEARADPSVRGIVIAGAGKAFVAGADIRFFVRNIEEGRFDRIVDFADEGHALLRRIETCPKPVIARLDGLALGGGAELALACDQIVADGEGVARDSPRPASGSIRASEAPSEQAAASGFR